MSTLKAFANEMQKRGFTKTAIKNELTDVITSTLRKNGFDYDYVSVDPFDRKHSFEIGQGGDKDDNMSPANLQSWLNRQLQATGMVVQINDAKTDNGNDTLYVGEIVKMPPTVQSLVYRSLQTKAARAKAAFRRGVLAGQRYLKSR